MPAAELAQKQVGKVAGIADVMQDCRATELAGIVDNQVSETEHALWNGGGNCDVLNFTKRNIACGARDQARVNFKFCVGQGVANHIPSEVVVRRRQQ